MILEGEPIMMGLFSIADQPAVILFDSGASHMFINRAFVMKCQLSIESMEGSFCIQSPRGHMYTKEEEEHVPINLFGHTFPIDLLLLRGLDIDVILGMNWLCQRGAVIDTLQRTIQLNLPDSSFKLLICLPTP